MIYAYLIGISLIFGYYNGWQWIDELDSITDLRAKRKWKAASVALRTWVASAPIVFSLVSFELVDFALALAISLPVFDMTINVVKRMPLFYLGKTSKTDRWGWLKWVGYALLLGAAITIKVI